MPTSSALYNFGMPGTLHTGISLVERSTAAPAAGGDQILLPSEYLSFGLCDEGSKYTVRPAKLTTDVAFLAILAPFHETARGTTVEDDVLNLDTEDMKKLYGDIDRQGVVESVERWLLRCRTSRALVGCRSDVSRGSSGQSSVAAPLPQR